MSRKKRGTRANRVRPHQPADQTEKDRPASRWMRLSRSAIAWIGGVTTAVLAAVLVAVITWAGPEAIDSPTAKDAIRDAVGSKDDIRYAVQHQDEGWVLALPSGVDLTAQQKRFLEKWSLDYRDPGGYDLNQLVRELHAVGGADIPKQTLRLALEGRRNQPIRVDSIQPINIRHNKPYSGTLLFVPPQDSGNTVEMMFNFDEVEPRARIAVDRDGGGSDYEPGELFFQKKTLTIKDAVEDTVVIRSMTTRSAVSFEIRIDYHIGNQAKYMIINDDGHPFTLTPANCVDRTRLAPDGSAVNRGHARYEQIWELRGDFQGIDKVTNPDHFDLGNPYC
jgi:hypothetical protein